MRGLLRIPRACIRADDFPPKLCATYFLIEAGSWMTATELWRDPLPRAMTKSVHLSMVPSAFLSPFHNSSWRPRDNAITPSAFCVTHSRVSTAATRSIKAVKSNKRTLLIKTVTQALLNSRALYIHALKIVIGSKFS